MSLKGRRIRRQILPYKDAALAARSGVPRERRSSGWASRSYSTRRGRRFP